MNFFTPAIITVLMPSCTADKDRRRSPPPPRRRHKNHPALVRVRVVWGKDVTTFRIARMCEMAELMSAFCAYRSCELSRMAWYYRGRPVLPYESAATVRCPASEVYAVPAHVA